MKVISQNTKLLVVSFFIILAGFGLLWYGLNPKTLPTQSSSPTPLVNITPVATDSASSLQATSAVVGVEGERVMVTKVIDGDTFEIEGGLKVRMLGIDTPETVDTRKPVGCFGKQASNEVKSMLSERVVILQKDISDTDKYNRLLRYVFLPLEDGTILFVNDYLLRAGFAKNLTYPPDVKYTEQFLQAEKVAKTDRVGLWGACGTD